MLMRPGVSRALYRGLTASAAGRSIRPLNGSLTCQARSASKLTAFSARRPQLLPALASKPVTTALVCRANQSTDSNTSKELGQLRHVRMTEETIQTTTNEGPPPAIPDPDPIADFMSDLRVVRETFSLREVPKDAYWLGLAGVLPYLGTALTNVYAAVEMEHIASTGGSWLLNEAQIEKLIAVLEPVQIGYGAMILSFLAAMHWGMEFARYGGVSNYRRYAIGAIVPAVSWPTLLLSPEMALISQFTIFTFLYSEDSLAARQGWAPPWYSMYRFTLTFIVGVSIFITLMARGRVGDLQHPHISGIERIQEFKDYNAATSVEWDSTEGGEEEE